MVGGANLIDKIKCENRIGYDVNENLIALLTWVQKDDEIHKIPDECSFELYKTVRENQHTGLFSREYIALIGFCASYGGRYFDGGYGRDKTGRRNIFKERLDNLREQAPQLTSIELECKDYRDIKIKKYSNTLFYFDPPYQGSKQYGKYKINHNEFHNFCRKLGEENIILISEYNMPNDFECVWSKEIKTMQKSDRLKADRAIEKLYTIGLYKGKGVDNK